MEDSSVTKIALNLITGRTIQQGVAMEGGKEKDAYTKACGIIELDPSDLKKLGAWRNTNVRVTSKHGSVVVKAIEATQGPHPGLAWIPMGTMGQFGDRPQYLFNRHADLQGRTC